MITYLRALSLRKCCFINFLTDLVFIYGILLPSQFIGHADTCCLSRARGFPTYPTTRRLCRLELARLWVHSCSCAADANNLNKNGGTEDE